MSKKIVICLDGTGNQMKATGHTNVATVFRMLDLSDPAKQIAFYDPGVGTMSAANARGAGGRWLSRMSGLAFGSGIKANLTEAYSYLMQHWRPGDELYIFGFSRGAYTARALVGMLTRPGLLRPGSENLLPYAIHHYATNKTFTANDRADMAEFSHAFCWGTEEHPLFPQWRGEDRYDMKRHCVPICYLGVWDTVKAAGILRVGDLHWPFTHQLFNAHRIRHAVSIDEYRRPYRYYPADPRHEGLEEVWFAGVHSDVGGTFEPDHRLACIALKWVVEGALQEQVRLRTSAYPQHCTVDEGFAMGEIHRMGKVWLLAGYRKREIPQDAKLHASVRVRRKLDRNYLPDLTDADVEGRWRDVDWTMPVG
jgi:uncharacterized protein (DUF2235 family)